MSIRTKLLALFLPLVILFVAVTGYLSTRQALTVSNEAAGLARDLDTLRRTADKTVEELSAMMDARTMADFKFLSQQYKSGVETSLNDLARMLEITARSPLVAKAVTSPTDKGSRPGLQSLLSAVITDYELLYAAVAGSRGDPIVSRSALFLPSPDAEPRPLSDEVGPLDGETREAWLADRVSESRFMHLNTRVETIPGVGPAPLADLSCPLRFARGEYDPYEGETLGYMILTVDLAGLVKSIATPRADFRWRVYLTREDGTILVGPSQEEVGEPFVLTPKDRMGNFVITQELFRGKLRLYVLTSRDQFQESSAMVSGLAGAIEAEAALSQATAKAMGRSLRRNMIQTMAVLAIALAVSVALAAYLSRRITSPIGRLREAAVRMASGDLNVSTGGFTGAGEEMEQLATSLETMRTRLGDRIQELDRAERKYRQIFENAREGIYQFTPEGDLISANPAMAAMLGYSTPGELMRSVSDVRTDVFADHEECARFFQAIRAGGVLGMESRLRRRNGEEFWAALSARTVPEEGGGIGYYEGSAVDVHQRRMAVEESRKFKFIADASQDFMTLINRDYVYEAANKVYCNLLGMGEMGIVGRRVEELWEPELFRRYIKPNLDECFQGKFVEYAAPIAFPGQVNRHYLVLYSPYRDESGAVTHAVVVSRDISKRMEAEALELDKAAAEAANKAKSQFLAAMSHEIRTPMNAILGMAELLGEAGLGPEERQYVDILQNAGDGLISLINDILDLSKVEAGRIELEDVDFDLVQTVENACEFLAVRVFEKNLELICRIDPDVPRKVRGDPGRLRQILVNLAGNAIKFTSRGEIEVSVEPAPEGGLLFGVRDTGIGIPEDKRESVFEEYSQADASTTRKFGGTGLGLAISRKFVTFMGGRIWVEEAPGGGSLFRFTAGLETVDARPLQPLAPLQGRPVIIASESSALRESLYELVERLGGSPVQTATAGDADQAARLAVEQGALPITLLAARLGLAREPLTPESLSSVARPPGRVIALVTPQDGPRQRAALRQWGADDVLLRPIKRDELIRVLSGRPRTDMQPDFRNEVGDVRPEATADRTQALRILLAEDNENNAMLFSFYLKGTDHKVTVARNGQEAVDLYQQDGYDVVFMDIEMPVMDGHQATARIREIEKESGRTPVPVIALSAHAIKGMEEKSRRAGCTGHMSKPFKKTELLEVLSRTERLAP